MMIEWLIYGKNARFGSPKDCVYIAKATLTHYTAPFDCGGRSTRWDVRASKED